MNKTLLALILIVVLAGGLLWYMQSNPAEQTEMSSSTAPVVQTTGSEEVAGPSPAAAVIGEHIVGTWKSESDPKNVIELSADAKIVWRYDGKKLGEGLYVIFTKGIAPKMVSFPMDESAVYMQTTETGSVDDTQNFRVDLSADTNTLTTTYMDRGGATVYTRVQ